MNSYCVVVDKWQSCTTSSDHGRQMQLKPKLVDQKRLINEADTNYKDNTSTIITKTYPGRREDQITPNICKIAQHKEYTCNGTKEIKFELESAATSH